MKIYQNLYKFKCPVLLTLLTLMVDLEILHNEFCNDRVQSRMPSNYVVIIYTILKKILGNRL